MFLTLGSRKLSPLFRSGETPPFNLCLNLIPRDISELKCRDFLLINFISWEQASATELFIQPSVVFSPQYFLSPISKQLWQTDRSQNLKCYYISECFWKLAAGQSKKHSHWGKESLQWTQLPPIQHGPCQLPHSSHHLHTPEQPLSPCMHPWLPHPWSWMEEKPRRPQFRTERGEGKGRVLVVCQDVFHHL